MRNVTTFFATLVLAFFLATTVVSIMPVQLVHAQTAVPTASPSLNIETLDSLTATQSASDAAQATVSAQNQPIQQIIQEKKENDITESTSKQKGVLAAFLDENPIEPLSWNNFIQHSIRAAVTSGMPANVIVLVLLFPLIASVIAASRHIIGLRGYGIYIPSVLAVALVSTGIVAGLMIFAAITLVALGTKRLLKKTRLSYLPRTALMIWTISLGLLALLLIAPVVNLTNLMSVNIFPILILVMLAENFLDSLTRTKPADAVALTIESLGLAFVSSLLLNSEIIQKWVLLEPELYLIGVVLFNFLVGKFAGLRITEWLRFRSLIEEE